MKKIVGIIAAAAVLATSVFAADVSAKVRLDGDIFAYDATAIDAKDGKAAGSFKLLRTSSQARPYWSPYITLSTSTDEAGAQILFIEEDDGNRNIQMDRSNVWFKPLDMLKVTAGFQGYKMNVETIDWSPVPTGAEDWGYGISYAQDAIAANVFFKTGNNGWFFKDAVAKYGNSDNDLMAYINELYFNFDYTADFGRISAMFDLQGESIDLDDSNQPTKYNPQIIKFGAGYNNTIDALTFFADAVVTIYGAPAGEIKDYAESPAALLNGGFDGVYYDKDGKARSATGLMIDGFVQYAQDALTVKGYLRMDIDDFGHLTLKDGEAKEDMMADNNFKLGIKARVDYKLDNGINLFAQFNNANLLQKETMPDSDSEEWKDAKSVFVSEIKLGANGSVGICDWEAKLKINTGNSVDGSADADENGKFDKVNISLPVWFQVAF